MILPAKRSAAAECRSGARIPATLHNPAARRNARREETRGTAAIRREAWLGWIVMRRRSSCFTLEPCGNPFVAPDLFELLASADHREPGTIHEGLGRQGTGVIV